MINQDFDVASAPTPAIIRLIEDAAFALESDRTAARDYLFRAAALIKTMQHHSRASSPHGGGLIAWQTKRVLLYIDTHLGGPIPVGDLAAEVEMSVSHFSRSFKASMRISPAEFVARRRLQAAQDAMRTTNRSLSRVAMDCGLSDQSHLCRFFRRRVGATPTEWRKLHAQAPSNGHHAARSIADREIRSEHVPARISKLV
jgi:AraC family transcriptional regulator